MPKVERLPSGSYRIRYTDPWGRRAVVTRKTTADVRAAHRQLESAMARGEYVDPKRGRMTLAVWADDWLLGARNLGAGGRDMYRQSLDHILPELGAVPLGKLSAADIDRYIALKLDGGVSTRDLLTDDHQITTGSNREPVSTRNLLSPPIKTLAPSTVHRHYRTLHRMLAVAVERGVIPRNPCEYVQPPRVPHSQLTVLDAGQVDALATAISPRYRAWVFVAAYGGLRWSETVGLRRRNVEISEVPAMSTGSSRGDFGGDSPGDQPGDWGVTPAVSGRATTRAACQQHTARVAVVEQLVRRRNGTWDRTAPKTGRTRTVTLPDFVSDEMAGHLDHYALPGPDGLVFCARTGNPMYGGSWTSNVFKPALARAGLPPVRVHDLRHTAVALSVAAGAHPKAVQERMGHSSIRTTLDIYGHLFETADSEVAAGLSDLRAKAQRARLRVV